MQNKHTAMQKTRFFYRFLFFSAAILITLIIGRAQAQGPINVGLLDFSATPVEDGIQLDWETATESEMLGFYLYRSPGTSDDFVRLDNIGFIDSEGDAATGATYSELDNSAVYNETYTYKLVEVLPNLQESDLETVVVTFYIPPTATPIVIDDDDPLPTVTQTAVPTSTPQPTATAEETAVPPIANPPTATHTPQPTPTDIPLQPTATHSAPDSPFSGIVPGVQSVSAQEPDATPYPAPTTTIQQPDRANESDPGGQPQPQAAAPALDEPTPYPVTTNINTAPTVAVIGYGIEITPTPEPPPSASSQAVQGRLFLWVGFIIALLIFATGVIGSIILYQRSGA